MNKPIFLAFTLFLLAGSVAAQQPLVGKYKGSLDVRNCRGNMCDTGLTLEILSEKDGAVTGVAERIGQSGCAGKYEVTGTVEGNRITLQQTRMGGRGGDCGMNLDLTVDGDKLVGTMNKKFAAQLSK